MDEAKGVKKGLILEGGAMRGVFTAGVTDYLMEKGVTFDGMIGVSAGAAFGCNCKSGQIGRAYRYNRKYCRDPRYCGVRTFLRTGDIFGADFCYRQIPDTLDPFDNDAFDRSPMEFYVVCTDVLTGKAVYHKCDTLRGKELEWLRASASMPMVSKIVEVDGRKLLDGGMSDSIPLSYFESIGYRRNLVILTRPLGYTKKKAGMLPLVRFLLRRYPEMADAMATRHERYNRELAEVEAAEKAGRVFVIRPPEALPASRIEHDPEKLRAAYETGRETAEKNYLALSDFLS